MKFLFFVYLSFFGYTTAITAQETLPIFSDYLSDNIFLIHPAAAGVGTCGKLRLTAGRYWKDNELQTLSFHSSLGNESKAAAGLIVFNDKNGYHAQKGFQGTFAYHLDFYNGNKFNQLSFGLSLAAVQNEVDQRTFAGDPTVRQIIESNFYYNADVGVAYHYGGLSSYFTVKNVLLSIKDGLNNDLEYLNVRNFVLHLSYFFGDEEKIQYEPSLMLQYRDATSEMYADINFKAYKKFEKAQLWFALSYRTNLEQNNIQNLQQFTPIIGANMGRWMASYTYAKQTGSVVYSNSAFHQITLGVNLFCKRPRATACPNINGSF
ncbi:type IX secretion system membrane protein PorP/SprF [Tenacibaculum sp. UWU-22]|uniref:PorP/SprF family type IX secretion system membrane protein n=1 Tax=Tenacibaculum sp. UWU-22 TaxID=3234187 RepID=UPI0034DB5ADE